MQSIQELAQKAIAALQQGQAETARSGFEEILFNDLAEFASAKNNIQLWIGLAYACGNCKDGPAALDAINQALKLQPQNPQALLFKADHLWHSGETNSAAEFYLAILQYAQTLDTVPPELAAQLPRAQENYDSVSNQQLGYLKNQLEELGISGDKVSPRFEQALAISQGEKIFYSQQPSKFFFPELPHIQFFETEQFSWCEKLESLTSTIKSELQFALQQKFPFEPYLQTSEELPQTNLHNNWDNDDWGALYLWKNGELNTDAAKLFPQTIAALANVPLTLIQGTSPNVLFSRLRPGTKIPPHHGFLNTRLICHLPLIIPTNCGKLRVGNESRSWQEGKLMVFDDSIEHEAENNSEDDRIVLIFEVWRPELTKQEQNAISKLLQAIKSYSI